MFLKKTFGVMGSPAPLFQHMWKLDHFLTFSSDCASFDHFQKLLLFNFWSFFLLVMLLLIFKGYFHYATIYCKKVALGVQLRLVSAIFYQIFISHQMIALQKPWKMLLFHLKSSFRSRDFQIFYIHLPLFFPLSAISLEVDQR